MYYMYHRNVANDDHSEWPGHNLWDLHVHLQHRHLRYDVPHSQGEHEQMMIGRR